MDGPHHGITRISINSNRSSYSRIGKQRELSAPTQNIRPRPGRRRHCIFTASTQSWLVLIFTLLTLSTQAEASSRAFGRRSSYGKFVEKAEIHIDRSSAPKLDLVRRDSGGDLFQTSDDAAVSTTAIAAMSTAVRRPSFSSPATAVSASATGLGSIVAPTGDSTSSASPAETSIVSAGGGETSIPTAFDGGLGSNYTEPSCPLFLNSFLNNDTFTACMPFSLLLQTSMSFFSASKSAKSISSTLDSACKVVFPTCSSIMSTLAQQLLLDSNCGNDYKLQNPMVRQAHAGLVSYDPLYKASCLKDTSPSSSSDKRYCFANAVTNVTSPADSYVYYLPLGMPLPGGSQLTCSACLKGTMGFFAESAGNKSQPINAVYKEAAMMINMGCGPGFVNQSVALKSQEGAAAKVKAMYSPFALGALAIGIGALVQVL